MNETVIYAVERGIATITLNRPEHLNTMSAGLLDGVTEALHTAASDDGVRVVIMTGNGRAFCAGGDLGGMAKGPDTAMPVQAGAPTSGHTDAARVSGLRQNMRTSQLLRQMPKATIAAINGPCAGAGLAWACAADLRYCAQSAVFNTAFMTAGLSGDFGGTWTLPRIVGPAKARELYLMAEKFDGQQAERIGLVARCVPDEMLMPEVKRVAERLAGFAPLTLAAIKANLNDSPEVGFAEMLDREAERHVRCALTEDAREAAAAFLEKRVPTFKGR
jgi:2-(1,2-epoxy-1,2-dihydrophenyl)acetyl-CoA isomerase